MKIFKSKEKQADKLQEEYDAMMDDAKALQEDEELPMDLKAGGVMSGFAVQVKDVGFGYATAAPGEVGRAAPAEITAEIARDRT